MRLLLTILFSIVAIAAQAKEIKMGDVTLQLPIPDGYCEGDTSAAKEQAVYDVFRKSIEGIGNALLLYAVDCNELRGWRKSNGKQRIRRVANFQTNSLTAAASFDDSKKGCDDIRARGQAISDEGKGDMKKAIHAASKKRDLQEQTIFGVLEDDPTGCYVGLSNRTKMEDGFLSNQLKVVYMGVIKGRMIFGYFEKPFAGGKAEVEALLKEVKRSVAALKAAN